MTELSGLICSEETVQEMVERFEDDDGLIDEAAALRRRGENRRAIELYTTLLHRHPISALFNERGLLYAGCGDYQRAFADFTDAIALTKDDPDCFVNRGNLYLRLGNTDAAIDDYDSALAINDRLPQAYNNRGAALMRSGRLVDAANDFMQALAIDGGYTSPSYNLAMTYLILGQAHKALPFAARAACAPSAAARAHCLLGDVQWALGDVRAALGAYADAVAKSAKATHEKATAARVEQKTGNRLIENAHVGADFVDEAGGAYEVMGYPGGGWDEQAFITRVGDHLNKAGVTLALDMTGYTAEQIAAVNKHFDSLPAEVQGRIIKIGF